MKDSLDEVYTWVNIISMQSEKPKSHGCVVNIAKL